MIPLNCYVSGNRRGAGRGAKRTRYAQRTRIRGGPRPYPVIYTNITHNVGMLHYVLIKKYHKYM